MEYETAKCVFACARRVCVCVWRRGRLVKWDYVHRWKGQTRWPTQTGRQLVWPKNAWKNGKVTSFNSYYKSSKSHQRDRDRPREKKAVGSGSALRLTDGRTAGKSGDTPPSIPWLVICSTFYDPNKSSWGEIWEQKIVLITIPRNPRLLRHACSLLDHRNILL